MPIAWLRSALARLKGPPAASHDLPPVVEGPQPPGEPFKWASVYTLTALEPVVLGLPAALVAPGEMLGSAINGDDDMQVGHDPSRPDLILVRLAPGMSVSIARSCQAVVLSDDRTPVALRMTLTGGPGAQHPGA